MSKFAITELARVATHQMDRFGVLLCRIALNARRSAIVDRHAFRILLTHLDAEDVAFLKRTLGPTKIDLNRTRDGGLPSPFCGMLWVLALNRRWGESVVRNVEFQVGASSFQMDLDLSFAPECTYYAEDPTPSLTRILRVGGQVFYDIGANVGFHALTGSVFFAQSHAFEPTPDTVTRLKQNLALNPGARLHVHPIALSASDGRVKLQVSAAHPGANNIVSAASAGDETVEVVSRRLDSYRLEQNLPHPDLIKIDVEGHECDVLRGAIETIESARPTLFVEVNGTRNFRALRDVLPASYEVYSMAGLEDPVAIPHALEFEHGRDMVFVDRSRKEQLFEGLRALAEPDRKGA